MNGIVRSIFKLTSASSFFSLSERCMKPGTIKTRLFSNFRSTSCDAVISISSSNNHQSIIKCFYSTRRSETEVQLVTFLEEEISAEQQLQRNKTIPSKIDDFEVKLDGSDVLLVKKSQYETIKINFNINNSIEEQAVDSEENVPELNSKPEFCVTIESGDTALKFICSFVSDHTRPDDDTEESDDVFKIDDFTIYKEEQFRSLNNYSVSGEILDYNLYNLLMNLLDEKGITNEFVLKMSELSTAYEHSLYISLLSELKKFVSS